MDDGNPHYTIGQIEGVLRVYDLGLTTPEKCLVAIQEVVKRMRNEQAKKKAS